MVKEKNVEIDYKFNEAELVKEFQAYIDCTYANIMQKKNSRLPSLLLTADMVQDSALVMFLSMPSATGKKGTSADARKDLMKVLHYALIGLYIHDNE